LGVEQVVYDPRMTAPAPSKVIGVHVNYRSRAEQRGHVPDVPSYFFKPPSSVAGDGDTVTRPRGTELLACEGEIAVVIGKRARHVNPVRGLGHVGWVAPANDFGLYDFRWVDRGSNVFAKGHDGFTPIGPLVALGDVDPEALTLRTLVNGEVVQEDSTANMLFPFGFLVADISRFITLEAGDVILTGTPAGSRPVEIGDVVEVVLDGVGRLSNAIVEAPRRIQAFGAQPRVSPAVRAAALGVNAPRPVTLSDEAKAALRAVSTATLTTQLRRHGVRNTFMTGLRSTRPDLRLVGYAHTLRYVPLREDVVDTGASGLNAQKRAVESIGPEEVLVIDARREAGAGTIGDILAARVLARGGAGIVTDGGLRDSPAVAALDIPTYYQAPHANVLGLLHHPLESNVPIACGGTFVEPGDVIVGDAEGVLVLPARLAEQVARDALEQELREEWAFERVRDGESTVGVFPLDETRLAEFEAWRETHRPTSGAAGGA
jgi:5-oxopent-3-ene-1,2,5-tricarboxylate decarboxylase / 2-hydroxyhepta-2,4-diene-1,7-dioate isomerase